MDESRTTEKIRALLQEGLDHYGEGRVEEAERCWGEVLFLDSENVEARDYLQTLQDEGDIPKGDATPPAGPGDLVDDALSLMHEGHLEAALELFETVTRRESDRLDVQGYVDMVRSKLLTGYRERVGGMDAVPAVDMGGGDLMKYNLPATAGFLLSLVDGQTTVNDLVSLSGLDPFDALRTLTGLLDAGILRSGA
jgi:tetratricopeptide (TPR) repeat protein